MQKTTFLLNQCIGEENQGRLQNDKELKILRKDFRKYMEKLSLLMSKKKNKLKQLNTRNINEKLNRKEVLNNHLKSKET